MDVILKSKMLYAKGSPYQEEVYNAVLDSTPGSRAIAYLKVEQNRESLVYRSSADSPEFVIAKDTYILSPHFAAGYLFWVQRVGQHWLIRGVAVKNGIPHLESIVEPFPHKGRPLSLSSCQAEGATWMVWEERDGKSTIIRSAKIEEGHFGVPIAITNGDYNAYDPVCATTNDGILNVAYCAFLEGNYRILVQKLESDGTMQGKPYRFNNRESACVYPSISTCSKGGVWISFTHFDEPRQGDYFQKGFVQHHLYRARQDFFRSQGIVSAGIFDGEKLWGVLAPPEPNVRQGFIAAMEVFGSAGSKQSQIIEDSNGRVRLLLRKHNPPGDIHFQEQDSPPERSNKDGTQKASNMYPDICIVTLQDQGWSEPVRIIPRAHLELPVSYALDNNQLSIAFCEDGRQTGWFLNGERFDDIGQSMVGLARLEFNEQSVPSYELRPFVLQPLFGPSMEEPLFESCEGHFIHAMGQTHLHSSISVCAREFDKDPHLNYRFMQDVQHSNFGGLTDHDFNMGQTEMVMMRKLAEYYYFPGKFVALQAYEWTGSDLKSCSHGGGPFGHVNPLSFEEEGDMEVHCPSDRTCPGDSLLRLWEAYAGRKIITIPHHVADNAHPYNWNFFEESFVPVIEIFQDYRGSGEQPGVDGVTNSIHHLEGNWALAELKKGKRFGFIASADHCGMARAGILVKELTRSGLYEALMAKRCFASTGLSLQMEFSCNDRIMGQEVHCQEADFSIMVNAYVNIREIQIVRNGDTVEYKEVGQKSVRYGWKAVRQEEGEFWYCRILFDNGEIAWSSPIWLV